MGFLDKVKGAIYESDDNQREVTTPTSNPIPAAGSPAPEYAFRFTESRTPDAPPAVLDTDSNYKHLLDATDPSGYPDLYKVYQLAKPLESIITDPALRMRAAFAQSGVTSVMAAQAVDVLLDRLKHESETFDRGRGQFAAAISADKDSLRDLTAKVAALQTKISTDLQALAERTDSFTRACARRRKELEDLKQQFARI